ncbi:DUF2905 domain-containing protein [Candidatus Roizmanbacteria bacterium]|nr:DUF2905 domain-containing protein [Candidatus Roizmanbacteria bacterium]
MNNSLGNTIIIFGLILVLVGIGMHLLSRFGIPKLPGDILIEREGFTFYFPIVSSIVISIILTILFNVFMRK